jgi:hypothetical protein
MIKNTYNSFLSWLLSSMLVVEILSPNCLTYLEFMYKEIPMMQGVSESNSSSLDRILI